MKTQFSLTITVLFAILLTVFPLVKCDTIEKKQLMHTDIVKITLYILCFVTVFTVLACTLKNCNTEIERQSQYMGNQNQIIPDYASTSTVDMRPESGPLYEPMRSQRKSDSEKEPTYVNVIALKQSQNENSHHVHGQTYAQIQRHIQVSITEETIEQLQEVEHAQGSSKNISEKASAAEDPSGHYEQVWFRERPTEAVAQAKGSSKEVTKETQAAERISDEYEQVWFRERPVVKEEKLISF